MSLQKIKKFYKENPIDLSFLSHCSWRQFRFMLPNRRFWKVPQQISGNEKLNIWLQKRTPYDVYYSTSCWLNPTSVGARNDILSQNLFLFSDLVFDIDGKNSRRKSIENARKECVKLALFLESLDIKIKYIAFSGSKGFHIVCDDPFDYSILSPLVREEKAKERKKEIVREVVHNGITFDTRVTVDTRRILRVPGTINSKSGLSCRILSRDELFQNRSKEIIKNTKKIDISALMIPRGNDWNLKIPRKIMGLYRFRARSNPPLYYYASFLSNKVADTKLYIPIIECKKTNETKINQDLITIMETYRLNNAFLFKGDYYFIIVPFALQRRRVDKVLSAAHSLNLASFRKYKQTFTRVSSKVDMNFKKFEDPPTFVHHFNLGIAEKPVSASHQQFLIDQGIWENKDNFTVGSHQYIIRHSVIEN